MFHPQPQPQPQQQGGGAGMMMGMGGTPRQNMAEGGGMMAPPPGGGASSSNVIPGVGGVGTGNNTTTTDIYQENFDPTIKVPTRIVRPTTKYVPVSMTLAHTTKVSLGAIIRPLAPTGPDEEDVLVVQPGPAGIVRCKR
jgi:protein transport protein SEC24